MSDNLEIWNKLGKTDPAQTKKFKRAGGFTGTAIKPIYAIQKMTEVFGPAGEGWGTGEPDFQVVNGVNQEILVYCTVGLWIKTANNPHWVWGVGGDKVVSYVRANDQYNRPERWENDDEAFKKAFTDAVGNAMKHLGMSADVHMGLFDDSKYVREREEEERAIPSKAPADPPHDPQIGEIIEETLMSKEVARGHYEVISKALASCTTLAQLQNKWIAHADVVRRLPEDWQLHLVDFKDQKKSDLTEKPFPLDVPLTPAQKIAGTP